MESWATLKDMTSGNPTCELTAFSHDFVQHFRSSRCSVRLSRLLTAQRLDDWGWASADGRAHDAALVVGELAANAVAHGTRRGEGFVLRLATGPGLLLPDTVRIEVTDTGPAPGRWCAPGVDWSRCPADDSESGRGLLLVNALAARWGVTDRSSLGKTVWAEIDRGQASAAGVPEGRGAGGLAEVTAAQPSGEVR